MPLKMYMSDVLKTCSNISNMTAGYCVTLTVHPFKDFSYEIMIQSLVILDAVYFEQQAMRGGIYFVNHN